MDRSPTRRRFNKTCAWRARTCRALSRDPLQVIAELLRCRDAAARLLRSQWGATRIAKSAEALLRQGTLRGEQIFAFC